MVGRNLPCDENTEMIDLSNLTVTPGMIDAHIHGNLMKWQEMDTILYQSESYSTLAYLHTAQRCLERGFTSIRDVYKRQEVTGGENEMIACWWKAWDIFQKIDVYKRQEVSLLT